MKKILLIATFFYSALSLAQCEIQLNSSSCQSNMASIQILSGEIYDQYQWYFKPINSSGDFEPIVGATSPSLNCDWSIYNQTFIKLDCIYNQPGFFNSYFSNTIELNQADCTLGITNVSSGLSQLQLYPNPVTDCINLSNFNDIDQMQIFNSLGKVVLIVKEKNSGKIDTSSLTAGVYILKVNSGKDFKNFKFVKL